MDNPLIRKLEQFRRLSNADKRVLHGMADHVRDYARGQDIISLGERPDHVHLLLDGWAGRYKLLPEGNRHIVAYLIPGDLCDVHIALLDRMDHSIGALSDCRVAIIPLNAINDILNESGNLSRALLWSMLVDEAILREWLVSIGARSAEKRTAHFICEMLLRCRAVGLAEGDSFRMPLTQQEVADTLGLSAVHMNRTLKQLRRRELVRIDGKSMIVEDLECLMAFADFDPLYLHQSQPAPAPGAARAG